MALYVKEPKVIRAYQGCDEHMPDWLRSLIKKSAIGRDVITLNNGASWSVESTSYIIVNNNCEAIDVVDKDRFEGNYILYKED